MTSKETDLICYYQPAQKIFISHLQINVKTINLLKRFIVTNLTAAQFLINCSGISFSKIKNIETNQNSIVCLQKKREYPATQSYTVFHNNKRIDNVAEYKIKLDKQKIKEESQLKRIKYFQSKRIFEIKFLPTVLKNQSHQRYSQFLVDSMLGKYEGMNVNENRFVSQTNANNNIKGQIAVTNLRSRLISSNLAKIKGGGNAYEF